MPALRRNWMTGWPRSPKPWPPGIPPTPTSLRAPFAINQIVHKSNDRLEHDMQLCAKYKVPMVITSLGAREDVNQGVHSWGGVVLHDIINNKFAHKAIEKGADGLIAVAAGAGGHAGSKSPFALVQEIRQWFDGPLALSGAIATGDAILAAQAMGADLPTSARPSSPPHEAPRQPGLQAGRLLMAIQTTLSTPTCSPACMATTWRPSIRAAGLDPEHLPEADPSKMNFGGDAAAKAWKDIWGCGQGIGAIDKVQPAAELVAQLQQRYQAARQRLQLG